MDTPRIFTIQYIGNRKFIDRYNQPNGDIDMKLYKERSHKTLLQRDWSGTVVDMYMQKDQTTKIIPGTDHKLIHSFCFGLEAFTRNWDIIERRILLEKVGHTW